MDHTKIKTLGELKASDYAPQSIREEMRQNLIKRMQSGETSFPGIVGFDDTVIPDLERAILSKHNILLLGLRGQAKTRIARLCQTLLDDYIPVIEGSEINDDPLAPISRFGKDIVAEMGDKTPVRWLHRDERYVEKLATPDVSIADLVGDVDPIKAATLKLPYSDERVIHFGLITRAHRCIFVINELPDLQARIQVSLFNILQEEDLQIRGFKLRLPLDVQFIFTANPEDYTNRGSIITPLKDRIESQILTHYPTSIEIAKQITQQEAKVHDDTKELIQVSEMLKDLLEYFVFELRESELTDEKSGVSARLSIAAYENLISTAERRMILNKETKTQARLSDFWGIIPAVTGKVELVYEGEQIGPYNVAINILNEAIKQVFLDYFPHPEKWDNDGDNDPYGAVKLWFADGNEIDLPIDLDSKTYQQSLENIPGLTGRINDLDISSDEKLVFRELLLNGLAAFQIIGKQIVNNNVSFRDELGNMLDDLDDDYNLN